MKRLFIFFVVLCCGLHLSAMGGAMEDAIEAQNIEQVNSLLQRNPELATTAILERNNVHCSDMTKNNTFAIAKLLLETQGNKIDLNVYGGGKLTHACAPNLSASYNDKCTLLDQMNNDAEYHKKVEKCVPNPKKSTKLVKCYKWEVCEQIADLLKNYGARTYADLHGSGNSSASNQSSSQRQANNVSSNTQPVTNTETKKEDEKKEYETADKNTAADRTITVSGTVVDAKTGETIPGATILVTKNGQQVKDKKGNAVSTPSDINGNFNMQNVPVDAIIKISVVGYEKKEFDANSNLQTVELIPTATELKETIIEECRENSPVLSCVIERDIAAIKNTNVSGNDDKIFAHGYTYFQLPDDVNDDVNIDGLDDAIKVFESKCEALKGTNNIKNVSTALGDERDFYKSATTSLDTNTQLDIKKEYIIARCRITECDTEAGYELQGNTCVKKQNDVKQKPEQPKRTECKDGAEWNGQQCVCKHADYIYKDDKCVENENLKEKRKAYDDAKEKQQSLANRTLTAATVAATGIGGMELARGLAEQSADRDAVEDMDKYIQTMRCEYGNGKSVKTIDVKNTEIELPGGNDQNIMNYRAQYLTLAADLKVRKEALGMKPGIESEEILDKATAGLYDDENTGITSGSEASLYRAQMLKSEKDKTKLDEASAASQRRVTGGAIATGVGVVGGALGNQIINGELGEKIKDMFKSKKFGAETQKLMDKEAKALDELKSCLKTAGVKDTDKLKFEKFYPSVLSVKNINCKTAFGDRTPRDQKYSNIEASDLFIDSDDAKEFFEDLVNNFSWNNVGQMIGYPGLSYYNTSDAIYRLKIKLDSVKKQFEDAEKKDRENAAKQGIDLAKIFTNNGFGNFKDMLSDKDFMSLVQNMKK